MPGMDPPLPGKTRRYHSTTLCALNSPRSCVAALHSPTSSASTPANASRSSSGSFQKVSAPSTVSGTRCSSPADLLNRPSVGQIPDVPLGDLPCCSRKRTRSSGVWRQSNAAGGCPYQRPAAESSSGQGGKQTPASLISRTWRRTFSNAARSTAVSTRSRSSFHHEVVVRVVRTALPDPSLRRRADPRRTRADGGNPGSPRNTTKNGWRLRRAPPAR